jgi:hypothetical protein
MINNWILYGLIVISTIYVVGFVYNHRNWIYHPTLHRLWILILVCSIAFMDDFVYIAMNKIFDHIKNQES